MKKYASVIVASLIALVILGMGGVLLLADLNSETESACRFYFQSDISIEDGKLTVDDETGNAEKVFPFTLSKDSDYHIRLAWEALDDERSLADPGFLTVLILKDSRDEIVTYCSGGWLDNEMELDRLKAGEYKAYFRFFVDERALRSCLIDLGEDISEEAKGSYDGYESFGEDGFWEVYFTFELEEKDGVSYQNGVRLGVLFGVVIGILAAILLILLTKKEKTLKGQYDERQEFYRGRAFKYGFFTMLICLGVEICLSIAEIDLPMDQEVEMMLTLILGILVFGCYRIWKDAYFSLNDKKAGFLIMLSAVGLSDLMIGVSNLLDGSVFVDGILTFHSLSLLVGIMFVILLAVVILKVLVERKEHAE